MSENPWGLYDAARSEERALAGDWRAQIAVITRQNVDPAVLAAVLNQPGLHEQVQLAITERRDVTVEQLEFLAQRTESAVVINRIIQPTGGRPSKSLKPSEPTRSPLRARSGLRSPDTPTGSWPAAGRPGADNQALRG
jgi:hypothetical protein